MHNIQAAIFDVDGTLFDYREKKIHDSTVKALTQLKEAGVIIIVASGRSYPLLGQECLNKVDADYYVSANGHSVLDRHGREIFAKRFTYEQTQRVVDLTRRYGNGLILKYNTHSCIYSRQEEMFAVFNNIGLNKDAFTFCPEMNYHVKELPVGFTIRGCEGMKRELAFWGKDYRIELFHDVTECDVFSPNTNKMTALLQLSELLELNPLRCVAYGDSRNDIEMVRWAGLGVAMGNACEELKMAANEICASSWDNGIFNSVRGLVSIR